MDDISVKGFKTIYNNEEIISGIRRYILEHIIWMDGVLADLERVGCTTLGAKLQFCMPGLRVVGFIYDVLGRYSDTSKVIKIVEWPLPNDVVEARAFIRVAVYYRVNDQTASGPRLAAPPPRSGLARPVRVWRPPV
jgi:hypothetical protein